MTGSRHLNRPSSVSIRGKESFPDFDLNTALADIRANADAPGEANLCEVRLAPRLDGEIKLETVLAWPLKLDPACFAARIYGRLEKAVEAGRQAKIAAGKKVREPNAATINARLIKLLEIIPFENCRGLPAATWGLTTSSPWRTRPAGRGTNGEGPPAGEAAGQAVVLCGKRGSAGKRHFFESPGAGAGRQTSHADLNGAYNMIRKIFKFCRHHAGLSSRFLLAWLSPKLG